MTQREITGRTYGEETGWDPTAPGQVQPQPIPPAPPSIEGDPFADAIKVAANKTPHATETVATVPNLVLHIDGDYLAYYASGSDDTVPGQARQNALNLIEAFRARVGADNVTVHNTADTSDKGERFLVAQVKPYQGHRSGSRKPRNHAYLREFLLNYSGEAFTSTVWADREADDAIGTSALQAVATSPGYAAIATKDKDMRMLPGHHINWTSRAVIVVPPGAYDVVGEDGKQYGLKWFWLQMLEGDSADNCPGLEYYKTPRDTLAKLGPKTAVKLLEPATTSDEACEIVMGLYQGAYQDNWADRFVEQAALLWMRLAQTPDIGDFATHAGHSRINAAFTDEVFEAVTRMKERVTLARAEIDALQS